MNNALTHIELWKRCATSNFNLTFLCSVNENDTHGLRCGVAIVCNAHGGCVIPFISGVCFKVLCIVNERIIIEVIAWNGCGSVRDVSSGLNRRYYYVCR